MGAIALLAERTPLLCAGQGADQVIALAASGGAPARAIDGAPGDAVRLKLLRSIMTKGMESLAVECLVAANAMGLRASLYEVLSDIDRTPLTTFMDAFVRSRGPCRTPPRRSPRSPRPAARSRPGAAGAGRRGAPVRAHSAPSEAARAQGGVEVEDSVPARLAWLEQLARQR